MDFSGKGTPLSAAGIAAVIEQLDVEPAALWAVIRVETRGVGFLPDRRPQILFERHVFCRETGGAFDRTAPEISRAAAGGYGAHGAHQYERLAAAISLDRAAALRSASWGIGQVMGFHAEALRYTDVEAMVRDMVASEDTQLAAMARFVAMAGLDTTLRRRDWTTFARGYNGADHARNRYDEKLALEYRALTQTLPDVRVRAAQVHLRYRTLDPGPVDGLMGGRTRKALERFQASAGLEVAGNLDDATYTRLARA